MRTLSFILTGICLLISPLAWGGHREFRREDSGQSFLSCLLREDRINAFFFRSTSCALSILDEGDSRRYGSLHKALETAGCTAGVNGGYFADDAVSSPLGLVIHRGQHVSPLATRGFTVAGVLYDTGNGIYLERSCKLSHHLNEMEEAIQGGPFLIERGSIIKGLNNTRRAPRTFVATDGRGQWCIAVTSSMTLHQLACWLKQGALGNFQVRTALNLDGGSSSAFCDKASRLSMPNSKPVRNYVGIRPRHP